MDEVPEFAPCAACSDYYEASELQDGYCAGCVEAEHRDAMKREGLKGWG